MNPLWSSQSAIATHATIATTKSIMPLASTAMRAFSFELGDVRYYSPSSAVANISINYSSAEILPLTVFKTNATSISAAILDSLVAQYTRVDDVWTKDFLGGALAFSTTSSISLDASACFWIESVGAAAILASEALDTTSCNMSSVTGYSLPTNLILAPGPYTISPSPSGTLIKQVYALHRDKYEAFLFGVTQARPSGAYESIDTALSQHQDVLIPVPSRLYWLDDHRPLAGLRVGLKDVYDLEGVKTGVGSRSYTEVYGPASATAVSVRKLEELGAVIVGKTKTSQFAHAADPWQFLDIHYPWNPRGDGYLTAASSSSGSAAAIAAYDWLDITVGSDTRGSVRKPAALVGSYGLRPTWRSLDLTGVMPLADEMDTAGFFARSPQLFCKVASLWNDNPAFSVNKTFSGFPKKLLYPLDYFPLASLAAQAIFEDFIDTLEQTFGMARTPINLSATMRASTSNPDITNATALQLASNRLAEYISYKKVGRPLADAWTHAHPGRGYPPIDPNPRAAFQRSMSLTEADYQAAVAIKNEFRELFLGEIMRPDEEACSESIMILDSGTGGLPSYREQALNSLPGATFLTVTGVTESGVLPNNYLASMSGCPQVCLPVGQVKYESAISLQEEWLPVNVDLMAAPGCDGMLVELVKRLGEMGVVKELKTGRSTF